MNKSKTASRKARRQYGALPYKVSAEDGVRVMLVTSRETKRWIIPKGWPMKDRKPYMAATDRRLLLRQASQDRRDRGLQGRGLPAQGQQAA